MRLKLFVAVTISITASIAAFAQSHEPDNPAPPTIEDLQKLVRAISGDKARLKTYCELGNLYEQLDKAQEKNDTKEFDALGAKIDILEQQVAPDYRQIMDGLGEVNPDSAEGQKLNAVFERLQEQCK
jgi:peptidoglycan hydrolase CwlO-like protein